jgi:hypothetical protein
LNISKEDGEHLRNSAFMFTLGYKIPFPKRWNEKGYIGIIEDDKKGINSFTWIIRTFITIAWHDSVKGYNKRLLII